MTNLCSFWFSGNYFRNTKKDIIRQSLTYMYFSLYKYIPLVFTIRNYLKQFFQKSDLNYFYQFTGMGNSYHTAIKEDDENCIQFEKHIYSKGSIRYAYKAKQANTNSQLIVKTFKNRSLNTKKNLECDIQASQKAASLVKDFFRILNNSPNAPCRQIEIKFVLPFLAKVNNASCIITKPNRCVSKDQYVSVEPFLTGSYIKYSDNDGFENKIFGEKTNVLFAFSHWTYENSDKTLLVSDLQGTDNENHFMLTDPAIHSKDETYGPTDCSFAGITRVMRGHSCNELCRYLKLPFSENTKGHKSESSTIVSHKLSREEKRMNKKMQQERIVSRSQIVTNV